MDGIVSPWQESIVSWLISPASAPTANTLQDEPQSQSLDHVRILNAIRVAGDKSQSILSLDSDTKQILERTIAARRSRYCEHESQRKELNALAGLLHHVEIESDRAMERCIGIQNSSNSSFGYNIGTATSRRGRTSTSSMSRGDITAGDVNDKLLAARYDAVDDCVRCLLRKRDNLQARRSQLEVNLAEYDAASYHADDDFWAEIEEVLVVAELIEVERPYSSNSSSSNKRLAFEGELQEIIKLGHGIMPDLDEEGGQADEKGKAKQKEKDERKLPARHHQRQQHPQSPCPVVKRLERWVEDVSAAENDAAGSGAWCAHREFGVADEELLDWERFERTGFETTMQTAALGATLNWNILTNREHTRIDNGAKTAETVAVEPSDGASVSPRAWQWQRDEERGDYDADDEDEVSTNTDISISEHYADAVQSMSPSKSLLDETYEVWTDTHALDGCEPSRGERSVGRQGHEERDDIEQASTIDFGSGTRTPSSVTLGRSR